MPSYDFVTVDVFTTERFGGNPLAVLPDARGLSDAAMQAIAKEFNLSETTFVLPPADPAHKARVRIFTPAVEMPFAGHPNVGTAHVLASVDVSGVDHYVFEELAGPVRVDIIRDALGAVSATRVAAPLPLSLGRTVPPTTVAACAGLATSDVMTGAHQPVVASVGAGFVIAEVTDAAALARAAPDLAAFRQAAEATPGMQLRFSLHLYTRLGPDRYRARMFGPLGGVLEDPATGSANAALAALLRSLSPGDSVARYAIEQGIEMGRPSLILAEGWRNGADVMASVAGSCVDVTRGSLTV